MSGFADPFLGLGPNAGRPHLNTPLPSFGNQNIQKMPVKMVPIQAIPIVPDDDDDEEVVDLKYIIKNKPKTKIVREFMRYNLCQIKSEEDVLFDDDTQ